VLPVPQPPLPLTADQCDGNLKKSSAVAPEENTQLIFHGVNKVTSPVIVSSEATDY